MFASLQINIGRTSLSSLQNSETVDWNLKAPSPGSVLQGGENERLAFVTVILKWRKLITGKIHILYYQILTEVKKMIIQTAVRSLSWRTRSTSWWTFATTACASVRPRSATAMERCTITTRRDCAMRQKRRRLGTSAMSVSRWKAPRWLRAATSHGALSPSVVRCLQISTITVSTTCENAATSHSAVCVWIYMVYVSPTTSYNVSFTFRTSKVSVYPSAYCVMRSNNVCLLIWKIKIGHSNFLHCKLKIFVYHLCLATMHTIW